MMVPQASSFWIGHAMCLQAMDLHNEALILLDFVKQIDPQNPLASYHMIQTLKALKEDEKAKEETETLKTMISQMNAEDKTTWEEMINNI
jgi:hypothetical protein